MRLIVAIFVSFCLFQTSAAISGSTLKLLIWAAEYGLKNLGTLDLLKSRDIHFNNAIANGSLACSKLSVYGLESLDVDLDKIQPTIEELAGGARNVTLNLNITIPKTVGIKVLEYKADVALPSDIPLYGKGNVRASTINLETYVHVNILLNGSNSTTLNELILKPTLGFVEISLTGFFNNPDRTLNLGISAALTAIANVVAAFWDIHVNCCSCALSTIVRAVLNNQVDPMAILNSLQADCKTICTPSDNAIVETLFRTENPLDLANYLASPAGLAKVQQYLDKFIE
ncbi:unnamed protein product [Ceutorhynchus assimilis]|uniref:Lipid-binding serum glycoprotein N-terminal domain-containing protein n=1 Tax=Ceutorhynchus assimilis TaxID=467358 RepID=A0A9N9MNK5_9CUCU|nr:unnamed protein product [Ceutorhynchus assimilis]